MCDAEVTGSYVRCGGDRKLCAVRRLQEVVCDSEVTGSVYGAEVTGSCVRFGGDRKLCAMRR